MKEEEEVGKDYPVIPHSLRPRKLLYVPGELSSSSSSSLRRNTSMCMRCVALCKYTFFFSHSFQPVIGSSTRTSARAWAPVSSRLRVSLASTRRGRSAGTSSGPTRDGGAPFVSRSVTSTFRLSKYRKGIFFNELAPHTHTCLFAVPKLHFLSLLFSPPPSPFGNSGFFPSSKKPFQSLSVAAAAAVWKSFFKLCKFLAQKVGREGKNCSKVLLS